MGDMIDPSKFTIYKVILASITLKTVEMEHLWIKVSFVLEE